MVSRKQATCIMQAQQCSVVYDAVHSAQLQCIPGTFQRIPTLLEFAFKTVAVGWSRIAGLSPWMLFELDTQPLTADT